VIKDKQSLASLILDIDIDLGPFDSYYNFIIWLIQRVRLLGDSTMYFSNITVCSLVGFSQSKPASQHCFPLTKNQHQPAQTSISTNQRTGPKAIIMYPFGELLKDSKVGKTILPLL